MLSKLAIILCWCVLNLQPYCKFGLELTSSVYFWQVLGSRWGQCVVESHHNLKVWWIYDVTRTLKHFTGTYQKFDHIDNIYKSWLNRPNQLENLTEGKKWKFLPHVSVRISNVIYSCLYAHNFSKIMFWLSCLCYVSFLLTFYHSFLLVFMSFWETFLCIKNWCFENLVQLKVWM